MISTDNLTFDILERLSKSRPDLKLTGHFARGTGGVDVDAVVRALDAVILQSAPEPQAVDDAMVERAHRAQMRELSHLCQPNHGNVFAFMDDRKDVMRAALQAAKEPPHEAG